MTLQREQIIMFDILIEFKVWKRLVKNFFVIIIAYSICLLNNSPNVKIAQEKSWGKKIIPWDERRRVSGIFVNKSSLMLHSIRKYSKLCKLIIIVFLIASVNNFIEQKAIKN